MLLGLKNCPVAGMRSSHKLPNTATVLTVGALGAIYKLNKTNPARNTYCTSAGLYFLLCSSLTPSQRLKLVFRDVMSSTPGGRCLLFDRARGRPVGATGWNRSGKWLKMVAWRFSVKRAGSFDFGLEVLRPGRASPKLAMLTNAMNPKNME